ncbi:MAG: hypothetical protein CMM54_12365 [Rhodospirillaceae bacterium]|nr:hypothetical protein [Rhodospirillaceae bacterium]|tara:strand:+ start:297 stop:800 length:504 start_codon:yes stop_codon:yes gene_type:complete
MLALPLVSCGLFADPPPPCPLVSIMDRAKQVTLYRPGPGRDLTDVTYQVEIRDLAYGCDYEFDDIGNRVTVDFNILFVANRGPAAEQDRIEIPYFVAVADPSKNILNKKQFFVTLEFEGNVVRTQNIEELLQIIPYPRDDDGSDYKSFVGIQLTPAQLEDIRRANGD